MIFNHLHPARSNHNSRLTAAQVLESWILFNSIGLIGIKRISFITLLRFEHLTILAQRTISRCCVATAYKTWLHDVAGKRIFTTVINLFQIMYLCYKSHFALFKHQSRLLKILFSVRSLVLQETRWRCSGCYASSPLLSVEQFQSISAVFNRF